MTAAVEGTTGRWVAGVRMVAFALATAGFYVVLLATRPLAPLSRDGGERSRAWVMRNWSRTVLAILGFEVVIEGTPPRPPFVLVANHLGYADIPVLATAVDGLFVAKSEIAAWPVFGLLSRSAGTIFVDRTKKADLRRVLERTEAALRAGRGVVFFPEGTSSGGAEILPFKPSMFELALRVDSPVHTASLSYRTPEGAPPASQSVCWWGDMDFFPHAVRLFRLRRVEATVAFGAAPVRGTDRKALAEAARAEVRRNFTPLVPHEAGASKRPVAEGGAASTSAARAASPPAPASPRPAPRA